MIKAIPFGLSKTHGKIGMRTLLKRKTVLFGKIITKEIFLELVETAIVNRFQ